MNITTYICICTFIDIIHIIIIYVHKCVNFGHHFQKFLKLYIGQLSKFSWCLTKVQYYHTYIAVPMHFSWFYQVKFILKWVLQGNKFWMLFLYVCGIGYTAWCKNYLNGGNSASCHLHGWSTERGCITID